jgi:hypothetical protein
MLERHQTRKVTDMSHKTQFPSMANRFLFQVHLILESPDVDLIYEL